MIFVLTVVILWFVYAFLLYRIRKSMFSLPSALLPLLLSSIIITIDLGFNYLAATNPSLNDGIGLHGFFAQFIFSDNGWSAGLFRQYYEISIFVSCVLTLTFMLVQFIKPVRKKGKKAK